MPPDLPEAPRVWRPEVQEYSHDFGIFRVIGVRSREVTTHREAVFSIIDCPDWANVVALTPAGQAILVRQYRPGVGQVTLEVPGGVVDAHESPLVAAERELREETGYVAQHWRPLGRIDSNPALQTNRTHTFLALDAYRAGPPSPDELESIEVELVAVEKLPELVREGAITHSLVVAALYLYLASTGTWTPRSLPADDVSGRAP